MTAPPRKGDQFWIATTTPAKITAKQKMSEIPKARRLYCSWSEPHKAQGAEPEPAKPRGDAAER
jgi:hypothetical protein